MDDNADIPFVPTSADRLKTMVELAEIRPGIKAADLGSGDGRVIIALAQAGAEAHGFEVNRKLVVESRKKIKEAGLENKAFVHQQNFWDTDLADFEIITLYGITSIMERLENKLKRELKTGAKVISNYFTFPSWDHNEKREKVYLYRK